MAGLGTKAKPRAFIVFLLFRFAVTLEVAVGKFFPGGFGWQLGAVLRDYLGLGDYSFVEYLFTGLGDGLFVFMGHCTYYIVRGRIVRVLRSKHKHQPTIDLREVAEIGTVLGMGSFCSGFVWQLVLNLGIKLGWTFWPCALFVGSVCSLAFFTGLRLGRWLLPMIGFDKLKAVHPVHWHLDFQLALSVFGSSALFVSTNAQLDGDVFRSFLGIYHDKSFAGMVRAGCSTALGFCSVMTIQNIIMPKHTHWLDVAEDEEEAHADEGYFPMLEPEGFV